MRPRRISPLASFVAGVVAAAWVLLAAPSDAHPASNFFNKKWTTNTVTYGFGPTMTDTTWRSAASAGASAWNGVPEASLDFNLGGNVPDYAPGSGCQSFNGVHRKPLGGVGGTLARTYLCWSSDGRLHSFQLVFDGSDRFSLDGTPATTESDLQSVAAHEFGHAAGFAGHFAKRSKICGNIATQHTMCAAHLAGTTRQRTLELHDQHTFASAY